MPFIPAHWRRLLIGTVHGLAYAGISMAATAAPPPDEAAIRHTIQATWDTPQSRVEVDPVVVVGRHAVAGWTQGSRGGRALMMLGKDGRWAVSVCAGDALKDAKVLQAAGLSANEAGQLSAALARAEQSVPAGRLAQFASFGGLVHLDGHAAPAASATHH